MRSSNASAPCRFELRPSRWLIGAMSTMAVLAPFAVLASEMPRWVAWPLAACAAACGAYLVRREAERPVRMIVVDGEGQATVDGQIVDGLRVDWRGPLAFVAWRDAEGRVVRRSLWPDTLSAARRRELRLAVRPGGDGQSPPSMAP
jgi:toxin CptA